MASLIPLSLLDTQSLKHQAIPWNLIVPTDDRRPLAKHDVSKADRNSKIPHAFDGDVLEYEGLLQGIRDECNNEKEWEVRRAELDKRMGAATAACRDVSYLAPTKCGYLLSERGR